MTRLLDGEAVAADLRPRFEASVDALVDAGVTPRVATFLMSDDDADHRFMDAKHERCAEAGVESERCDIDPDEPAETLYERLAAAGDDPTVNAVFVQMPLPGHVDEYEVRRRVAPEKDVDCFDPANLGRLVVGNPRFEPLTPLAVRTLLSARDVDVAGRDVTVVGRSNAIGKPLTNMLLRRGDDGDATVTVCHSRTRDLTAKTKAADIVVTAVGVPELVDGSMLSEGTVVVDISVNRVETDEGYELVGDVEFGSAAGKAGAITPVPGGVGPMTITMLLYNTVKATAAQTAVGVEVPPVGTLVE